MLLNTIDPPPLQIRPIDPEHLEGDLIQSGDPLFGLIWIDPERVSGAPCFYGTRVPVTSLFHAIAGRDSLEEFLDNFPGVTEVQALGVLDLATRGLIGRLDAIENSARPQSAAKDRSIPVRV